MIYNNKGWLKKRSGRTLESNIKKDQDHSKGKSYPRSNNKYNKYELNKNTEQKLEKIVLNKFKRIKTNLLKIYEGQINGI